MLFSSKIHAHYQSLEGDLKSREADGKLLFKSNKQNPFTLVWRIENKQGDGPYRDRYLHYKWQDYDHNSSSKYPTPNEDQGFEGDPIWRTYFTTDGIKKIKKNLLSGFSNREALDSWFSKDELTKLKKLGYEIVQKKAKRVWGSDKQVLFTPYEKG